MASLNKDKGYDYLITGCAGFIGATTALSLLQQGKRVIGIDNLNAYYDVELKKARLERLNAFEHFHFEKIDIVSREAMHALMNAHTFEIVIHLAAQAGVRYSIEAPHEYIDSNVVGFGNILELCRHSPKVKHLLYASSSSVYGGNLKQPYSEDDSVDHPISLYAATKKANELMAHTYSHLYGLPTTALRFFTVYGPWGRPDMALFRFTKGVLEGQTIEVYNNGQMVRDFTYVDDIVESIVKLSSHIPEKDDSFDALHPVSSKSHAPYRVYNIGNSSPVYLMDFIHAIEEACGKKAVIDFKPMQPGDVPKTYADTTKLVNTIGFKPGTDIKKGVANFVNWYRTYYRV